MLNLLPKSKTVVSNLCLGLLKKRLTGQITEQEFDRELAYVLLSDECFKELQPRMRPPMPIEYREYLNVKDKSKVEKAFFEQPEIKDYINLDRQVKEDNYVKVYWLEDAKRNLPVEDVISIEKINKRIADYKRFM